VKEPVKIALTLILLLAVSTASLAYVDRFTSEVIAQRDALREMEDMVKFFPTVVSVESKEVGGVKFKAAYGEEGIFLGVLAEVKARGYMGDIPYVLAINSEGRILDIFFGPNQETAGIGKKIEEEPFVARIIGLTPASPIELGRDIDSITGATESSSGMARSLRDVMDKFAVTFLDG